MRTAGEKRAAALGAAESPGKKSKPVKLVELHAELERQLRALEDAKRRASAPTEAQQERVNSTWARLEQIAMQKVNNPAFNELERNISRLKRVQVDYNRTTIMNLAKRAADVLEAEVQRIERDQTIKRDEREIIVEALRRKVDNYRRMAAGK